MQLELIVKSKFQRFKNIAGLDGMKDDAAFERFVIHSILSHHQPGIFASDGELLENICVAGPNDTGLDGIAIKLNDLLITGKEDAEDLLDRSKCAVIEFIFIQSKYKESCWLKHKPCKNQDRWERMLEPTNPAEHSK